MAKTKGVARTTGEALDLKVRQRMIKALGHPIRLRALTILNERVASPSEIAHELGESLGVVAYHMRTLERLECIELVRTAQRRGAVEHYYRAVTRPWIPDDQVAALPKSLRGALSGSVFTHLVEDVAVASKDDGLSRPDHCMVRLVLLLDEEAWEELSESIQSLLDRALELAGDARNRIIASGDEETVPAILGMQLFERRVVEHDRQLENAAPDRDSGKQLPVEGTPKKQPNRL